ncbi:MAG: hypothetical protein QOG53_3085 [Frankiales bacterium]|jgi:glutathione synthase/RimK-type ligase-like ATP-grasp enzyme|nr:hypothetical protein [Frankiales bacterium]
MRVALVTAAAYANLDPDLPLLPPALAAVGHDASVVSWDDASVDWSSYAGVVIRSTWDYVDRREDYLTWAASVETMTRLANPSAVLRWNSDKHYLRALAAAGVRTVPTVWPGYGDEIPNHWSDIVVKPAVSAGGRWTGRYDDVEAATAFARRLLDRNEAPLVQPYVSTIDRHGEIGIFFFGGKPSHAVRKAAILPVGQRPIDNFQLAVDQLVEPVALSDAPIDFAVAVLDAVPSNEALLYARVDCVSDDDGGYVLLEVELIEPSLFLNLSEGADRRYARAVDAWLRS